ncbi:glycosyltransferase [Deinococcus yavapaiensis]|uniref:glycosyltransferase n=1 Tax=Deinococcus yavapaiensis TaxID=309889 RepID=UPI000DA1898C|nr:glycosyltransferase family 2 protein [Deinococcus yavapaiensis]
MRISVVVPAYDEAAYLPRLLSALERQTRLPDEVIVVDNRSTDDTASVARAWGATVVACDTPGVAYARQAGLLAASGDWVASTDADSKPSRQWLEHLHGGAPNAVALYGPMRFDEVSPLASVASELGYRAFLNVMAAVKRPNLAGANMAFSRSAALLAGGYPLVEAREDVLLGFALARLGEVRYVPHALVETSARRVKGGFGRFLWQHVKNLGGRTTGYFERRPQDGS